MTGLQLDSSLSAEELERLLKALMRVISYYETPHRLDVRHSIMACEALERAEANY